MPTTGDEPEMIRALDGHLVRAPWDFPNRTSALCQLLNKIVHEALLLKTFGDHAEITATREKFSIDFYEHD